MLDLAMEEISKQLLWDYHQRKPKDEDNLSSDDDEPFTGGAVIWCYLDEDGHARFKYTRKLENGHKTNLETKLIEFMIGLENDIQEHIPEVLLQMKHEHFGQFFGAHTWFHGNVWHNWVFINWGDDGHVLPGKLNGFMDLLEL